jgi:hypothetical protein
MRPPFEHGLIGVIKASERSTDVIVARLWWRLWGGDDA